MKCSQCGRCHAHQKYDYPVGSVVIVENDFIGGVDLTKYDPTKPHTEAERVLIPAGSIGHVVGHTDDGRALIEFEAEKGKVTGSHSFHHPEGYYRSPYQPANKSFSLTAQARSWRGTNF